MLYLVLLPFLIALCFIAARSLEDALLDVYLPILVLVPMYYVLAVPHLITVSAQDAALLPIAIGSLFKYGKQWRLQRADIWITLFLLSSGVADARHVFTQGLRSFVENLLVIGLPYIVGKLLLEQETVRVRFLRRLLWLLAFVAVVSLVEFRLGRNLFTAFWTLIFGHGSPNIEQVRGGFERVQGPFGHAIGAGMIYGLGWILALWLRYFTKLQVGDSERKFLGVRRSTVLVWSLFMGLFIALSRGPWVGAVLSFAVSLIGRAKNVTRTAVIVIVLGLVVGGAMYQYLDAYTSAQVPKDQDQENAIYRRQLLDEYKPIATAGGLFGWGWRFPPVPGATSIDNYYLLLRLVQGSVGLWMFLLLSAEAVISLIFVARRSAATTDFSFAVSMLAVLAGMLLSLTSNGLGFQIQEIYFLCIGWSLSIRQTQKAAVAAYEHLNSTLDVRRTFT